MSGITNEPRRLPWRDAGMCGGYCARRIVWYLTRYPLEVGDRLAIRRISGDPVQFSRPGSRVIAGQVHRHDTPVVCWAPGWDCWDGAAEVEVVAVGGPEATVMP